MAQNKAQEKSRYDILQNDKGDILIIIQQRNGGAENPLFVYDGSQYALLYRSHESTVYFDDIAEGARTPLKSVTELQIVEINNDDVIREYKVPVRMVKDVRSLMDQRESKIKFKGIVALHFLVILKVYVKRNGFISFNDRVCIAF